MRLTIYDNLDYVAEADYWKLTRQRDFTRPSQLDLTFSRSVPIRERVKVELDEAGKIWFRGYVFSSDIKNKESNTVKCYGVEDLLFRRKAPRYALTRSFANLGSSFSSTWKPVYKLLEDDNPSLDGFGPRLGLLYLVNSALPDAVIHHYDDAHWTFLVPGFGTAFSTEEDITFFGRTLTKQTSLANCQATADSYYRDVADLYIHPDPDDFPDAMKGIIGIKNCQNTTIRLGNYSSDLNSTSIHMPNYRTDGETYGDLIKSIADWHGLDLAIRYLTDGTSPLDIVEDPGRGIENGLYEITEDDILDIRTKSPKEIVPQVLYGRGYGGMDARQKYTRVDTVARGFWLHAVYENDDAFADEDSFLATLVDAEWDRLQSLTKIYELDLKKAYAVNPYDYIKLRPDYLPAQIPPVEKLEYDSKGSFRLSLGQRDKDIIDAFNARGKGQYYAEDLLREGGLIWSTSGSVNIGDMGFLSNDGSINWGTAASVSIGLSSSYAASGTRVILEISTPNEDLYYNWVTLIKITCNDVGNDNTILRFYKTLGTSNGIDITDICPPGSTKTFKFYACYTSPQTVLPNPIVLNYTVKYVIRDDASAYNPPPTPGYTIVELFQGGYVSGGGSAPEASLLFDGLFGRPTPKDCMGLTKANGTLLIELKCDDPSSLKSQGQIEITSSGGSNTNEWGINAPYDQISTEWQAFERPLSSAVTTGGELNVAAINYLEWWNDLWSGSTTIYWRRAYLKFPTP